MYVLQRRLCEWCIYSTVRKLTSGWKTACCVVVSPTCFPKTSFTSCVCVCVHVCVCVCACVCVYMCVCTCVCVCDCTVTGCRLQKFWCKGQCFSTGRDVLATVVSGMCFTLAPHTQTTTGSGFESGLRTTYRWTELSG